MAAKKKTVPIGLKLIDIRPATPRQIGELGWPSRSPTQPIQPVFEDGWSLLLTSDDEGNGPGSFFVMRTR